MKYSKKSRQKTILSIIASQKVSTQEELVNILSEKNWRVTQATVSRDIRELGLSKASEDGITHRYVQNQSKRNNNEHRLVSVFGKAVTSFDCAVNLVIVKTIPGLAPACASAIDSLDFPEVLGTIAGDDTIFIAARSAILANHLMERMKELTEEVRDSED